MDDKKLIELAGKIKPLIRVSWTEEGLSCNSLRENWKEGELHFIEPVDIRTKAFTWDPVPVYNVKPKHLKKLGEIRTEHKDSYFFFKPGIEEVIKQIPNLYLPLATAFELHDPDLNFNRESVKYAKVTIYGYEEGFEHPDEIKNQKVILDDKEYVNGELVEKEEEIEPEM